MPESNKDFIEARSIGADIDTIVQLDRTGRNIDLPGGGQAVLVPDGFQLERQLNFSPTHVWAKRRFTDLDSLIRYTNRFKNDGTTAYVSREPSVSVIFDHHHDDPQPELHEAVCPMPFSEEWKAWTGASGKKCSQHEFAEFVDEMIEDIREPDGATMLEIAQSMRCNTNASFSQKVSLANDAINLTYKENIEGTAGRDKEMAIPEFLQLAIPIFEGGPRYACKARLVYSVRSGDLQIGFKLYRPDLVVKAAVTEVAETIKAQAGIEVYFGNSE